LKGNWANMYSQDLTSLEKKEKRQPKEGSGSMSGWNVEPRSGTSKSVRESNQGRIAGVSISRQWKGVTRRGEAKRVYRRGGRFPTFWVGSVGGAMDRLIPPQKEKRPKF